MNSCPLRGPQKSHTNTEAHNQKTQFYKNLKDWDCINKNGTYDLMKYSKIYCESDCKVLKLGMQKWKALWQEIDSRILLTITFVLMGVRMGVINLLDA